MNEIYSKKNLLVALSTGAFFFLLSLVFGSNLTVDDNTIENDPILPLRSFQSPDFFDAISFFIFPTVFMLALCGLLRQGSSIKSSAASIFIAACIAGSLAVFGGMMQGIYHFAGGTVYEVFITTLGEFIQSLGSHWPFIIIFILITFISGMAGHMMHLAYRKIRYHQK